jgi:hypothetical protein
VTSAATRAIFRGRPPPSMASDAYTHSTASIYRSRDIRGIAHEPSKIIDVPVDTRRAKYRPLRDRRYERSKCAVTPAAVFGGQGALRVTRLTPTNPDPSSAALALRRPRGFNEPDRKVCTHRWIVT